MHFYTTLINDRGGPSKTSFQYSYGAPHHGKGKWDGAGGVMKHKVDQDTSSAMTIGKLSYTNSGYIQNVRDVYDSLVHHFQNGNHRDRRVTRNGFHAWRFHLYLHDNNNNPVQRPLETFTPLKDISSHYQFIVRNKGIIYQRRRVCYCLHCVAEFMKGFTEWNDDTYIILQCVMASLGNDSALAAPAATNLLSDNVYTLERRKFDKITGPDVTRKLQQDKRTKCQMASSLNVGDWVIFDGKGGDEPIWLGRIMSNSDFGGLGIHHNKTRRTLTYDNGTVIGPNEVAMFVMWYEKIDIHSEDLEYRVAKVLTEAQIQGQQDLVCAGFVMHQKDESGANRVPRLRNNSVDDSWHRKELRIVRTLDIKVREEALAKCTGD